MNSNRRSAISGVSTLLWLGAGMQPSLTGAQGLAASTVRILVGAPAGGSTDTMARALAGELARLLNQAVVVENRPGAGGNIAADAVAKAPPNGATLLMSFTSHAINASLYPSLPFDPLKDFTPLSLVATSPSILVGHPSLPAANLNELIALAKQRPGKLNFAIGALGSSLHLAGDAFKMQAGVFIANIPYRGTNPAVTDVLAGHVELMFAAVGNVQQHVRSGKLRAYGVTSPKRLPGLPEVPAIAEVLPGYESSAWFGLFGPAKMPEELTQRLSAAIRAALATETVRQRLQTEGAQAVGNTPQQFAQFVAAEIPRWGKIVRFSGAKPE